MRVLRVRSDSSSKESPGTLICSGDAFASRRVSVNDLVMVSMVPVFRSQLFWKILSGYAVLSLLAMAGLLVTLDDRIESNQRTVLAARTMELCHRITESLRVTNDAAGEEQFWTPVFQDRSANLAILEDREFRQEALQRLQCTAVALRSVLRESIRFGQGERWTSSSSAGTTLLLVARSIPDRTPVQTVVVSRAVDHDDLVSMQLQPIVTATVFMWIAGCACVALVTGSVLLPWRSLFAADSANSNDGGFGSAIALDGHPSQGGSPSRFARIPGRRGVVAEDSGAPRFPAEQLPLVLESMTEGVLAFDESERILFMNASSRSLLDIGEVFGAGSLIYEAVRMTVLHDVVRDVIESRRPQNAELKIPRTGAFLALSAAPFEQAEFTGGVLVVRDISEIRRLEAIRRDFVAGVSHELKTPLTAIQVCTDTLLGGAIEDPAAAQRFLSQIDEHAERLMKLILGMLQLARVEAGKQMFAPVPVDVAELVDPLVQSFGTVAESRKISLQRSGELSRELMVDETALQTVVSNLIDNALKYSPEGGSVSVELRDDGQYFDICVCDTGPGIPEEHLPRVFERFYRVDRDRSRSRGGMGLGLAIVKHLCQPMNAECLVDSKPGHGCVFTIRFPQSETVPTKQGNPGKQG